MSHLKDIQVNTLMDEIRDSLEKALEEKMIGDITKLSPVKWTNDLGDFEYNGEYLYYKPNKPIKSIKIDLVIKDGNKF